MILELKRPCSHSSIPIILKKMYMGFAHVVWVSKYHIKTIIEFLSITFLGVLVSIRNKRKEEESPLYAESRRSVEQATLSKKQTLGPLKALSE